MTALDPDAIGHGFQIGPIVPEWGPTHAPMRCDNCGATWTGPIGEQCPWCLERRNHASRNGDSRPALRLVDPEEWPDPIPLGDGGDRPPFPIDVFPSAIGNHARQVAAELQLPVDLPAMLAITVLSICAHGRATVAVQGAWTEPLNTYLITALPPSAGKSPAFKAMLKPIEEWEAELVEQAIPERENVDTKRKIIAKAQARAIDKGETAIALTLADDLRDLPEIVIPRLLADDITPEKIPPMLAEHGGRLAVVSTEGGVFGMMTGRYSDKANLDVYLKSWSGDMLRVDRIGRPDTLVRSPALTIGLTAQPDVIRSLSETPELRGRGLTARFMYSLPADLVGTRDMMRSSTWNSDIAEIYNRRIRRIAQLAPTCLRPDDKALRLFMLWRQNHELRLTPTGELRFMAEWVTKLQSTTMRVAGLLHLADEQPADKPIDIYTMQRAIAVGDYWEAHARLAHDLWGADPTTSVARTILDWLAREQLDEFTMRDTYMANRKVIPRASDAVEPLNLLTERLWIKPKFEGELRAGQRGRDSASFTVHPQLTTLRQPSCVHASHVLKDTISSTYLLSPDVGETGGTAHETHETHEPTPVEPVDKPKRPKPDPMEDF